MHLTERGGPVNDTERQAGEIVVTPEMIQAGVNLLDQLHEPSSAWLVEEVYRAMEYARRKLHRPERGTLKNS
jgi:hypothetical protein